MANHSVADSSCNPLLLNKFELPIRNIQTFFYDNDKLSREQLLGKILKEDLRSQYFRVEAFLRLFKKIHEEDKSEVFKEFLKSTKESEDILGAVAARKEYLEYAQKVQAPDAAINVLRKQYDEIKDRLNIEKLKKVELSDEIESAIKKTTNDDLIDQFKKEIKKIEESKYDMEKLQDGIHELRRTLRWILIYIQSFRGLIQFSHESSGLDLNEYSYLLTHPIAESKYSKVEVDNDINPPRLIPFHLFLALSKIVDEVGQVKTFGENSEALVEAYVLSGIASNSTDAHTLVEQLLVKNDPKYFDIIKKAKAIYKELQRTELLKVIRKSI